MRHGFSLVELSIVLVILGLLTGGILAGQSLIRASELRAVSTEYSRYLTAVGAFRDKYFALPGDFAKATDFWTAAHATPATCVTTAGTGTQTCNGNGDGLIVPSAGSNESFRFWQHLANAGLIEGTYSGITQGANSYSSTSANSPRSKASNGYWATWYYESLSSNSYYFTGPYGNFLQLGQLTTDNLPGTPIFKPEEQWNIDTKIDDGKPGTGKMVIVASITACTTGADGTSYTADYRLNSTSVVCAPLFRQLF